jgi:transposase-like protein
MLVEMMKERGLNLTHTTIMRWVHQYSPIIEEKLRNHVKTTNDSWRMDETYLKVKGKNAYLYRAVDSDGNTIDFFLSEHRDKDAAKKFFKKALQATHNNKPRVITIDKYAATEIAIHEMIYAGTLSTGTILRKTKYLNNIIEQEH